MFSGHQDIREGIRITSLTFVYLKPIFAFQNMGSGNGLVFSFEGVYFLSCFCFTTVDANFTFVLVVSLCFKKIRWAQSFLVKHYSFKGVWVGLVRRSLRACTCLCTCTFTYCIAVFKHNSFIIYAIITSLHHHHHHHHDLPVVFCFPHAWGIVRKERKSVEILSSGLSSQQGANAADRLDNLRCGSDT